MADEATLHNPVPERLARVIPADVPALVLLGPPKRPDVYVTVAEDVQGLSAGEIAHRLGLKGAPSFYVIGFPAESIEDPLTTPVFRAHQCFVGGGRTRGGAREFIIPNQPVPPEATIREVR